MKIFRIDQAQRAHRKRMLLLVLVGFIAMC